MSINVGQVSTNLSDGERFYAYSGVVQGDITAPASITLISIPNTGLRDSFIKIQPFFGLRLSANAANSLGILVRIDDVEVEKHIYNLNGFPHSDLFVPRQSKLEIISLNTASNNTQDRGCTVLGWRL